MVVRLLFISLLFPVLAHAQHWRIEATGGLVFPHTSPSKNIPSNGPYTTQAPASIPSDYGKISGLGGLKIMRQDSAFEYGLGLQTFTVSYLQIRAFDTGYGASKKQFWGLRQQTVLAGPAIPLTAFFNYTHHRSRQNAFIGLSAGVVIAKGRNMEDVKDLKYYENFTIYFHNGFGYTIGGQLGFRRMFGHFDAGMQLALNFMHLSLTQGPLNTPYSYGLLYIPVTGYIGYSF